MIFFLLLLTLNLSCSEIDTKEKLNNKVMAFNSDSTKLKFKSGIGSIFQDSHGNIWFGSLEEGVAVYNGKSFRYFTVNEGLSDNQIRSIQEDNSGIIWFSTQSGVSSYDGIHIKNHTKSVIEISTDIFSIKDNNSLPDSWIKSENDLWFAASNKEGVYRYDGRRIRYLEFPPHKVLNLYDNLFAVTSISEGKNNMVWIATYAGVFGFDGNDFTIINDETLGFDRNIAPLHIRSILEDSKGRLWIGNNGIGVLLKEGESIINFSEDKNLIHNESGRRGDKSPAGTLEHVFMIEEDSRGNIWFADRDAGIWRYDGEKMKNYTKENGLSNDFAFSIYEDNNGKLWFGMGDGTVYQFIDEKFERKF